MKTHIDVIKIIWIPLKSLRFNKNHANSIKINVFHCNLTIHKILTDTMKILNIPLESYRFHEIHTASIKILPIQYKSSKLYKNAFRFHSNLSDSSKKSSRLYTNRANSNKQTC